MPELDDYGMGYDIGDITGNYAGSIADVVGSPFERGYSPIFTTDIGSAQQRGYSPIDTSADTGVMNAIKNQVKQFVSDPIVQTALVFGSFFLSPVVGVTAAVKMAYSNYNNRINDKVKSGMTKEQAKAAVAQENQKWAATMQANSPVVDPQSAESYLPGGTNDPTNTPDAGTTQYTPGQPASSLADFVDNTAGSASLGQTILQDYGPYTQSINDISKGFETEASQILQGWKKYTSDFDAKYNEIIKLAAQNYNQYQTDVANAPRPRIRLPGSDQYVQLQPRSWLDALASKAATGSNLLTQGANVLGQQANVLGTALSNQGTTAQNAATTLAALANQKNIGVNTLLDLIKLDKQVAGNIAQIEAGKQETSWADKLLPWIPASVTAIDKLITG